MTDNKQDNSNPEPLFSTWSDRIERHLVRWIIVLAVLLCLSQLVLQFPAVRYWITTTDDSEGVPFPYISP